MATVYYGTRVFSKFVGFYGPKMECPKCHRTYKYSYVKFSSWFHIYYLPLVPTKTVYFKSCPICGAGYELKKKEAVLEIKAGSDGEFQGLEPHAKHVLANKPKGIMKADNSYELWVKDLATGEDILVASEITKGELKNFKKERGYKKVPIETVE